MALKGIQNIDLELSVGFTEVTKAELDTLVTNSTLVPGTLYKVGVHPNLYNDGVTNLTPIFIRAATTNELELQGHGFFYNPLYTHVDANIGVWTSTNTYAVGTKTTWGGYRWTNLNGNVGAAASVVALNGEWSKIPFNTTDYDLVLDTIEYDYANNIITYRRDRHDNTVTSSKRTMDNFSARAAHPIAAFQWGNPSTPSFVGVSNNQVLASYVETINQKGYFVGNYFDEYSYYYDNTVDKNCYIYGNHLQSNSFMISNIVTVGGTIAGNFLENSSQVSSNTITGTSSRVQNNKLYDLCQITSNNISAYGTIWRNVLSANSRINTNSLSGGNSSFFNYIYRNDISETQIVNNTITGANSAISDNYSKGGFFTTGSVPSHFISGNSLASGATIKYNTLDFSSIQNANMSLASTVSNFNLSNFVLNFSNTSTTFSLTNGRAEANSLEYIFSKTFVGGTGEGSVGEIIIPHMPVPIGFFFEEVLIRVDTALVETANANFNLGMTVDGYSVGLGGATGDVGTLNSNVITKYILGTSGYTRASVLQRIYMEVGGASITSGAMTIIVRLAKIS